MWVEKLKVVKSNKLAALYPSVKFLIVCLYSLCSLLLGGILFDGYPLLVAAWFLVLPVLAAASGALGKFLRGMRAVAFIALVIFVVQSFLIPDTVVLWQWGFLKLYKGGLVSGINLGFSVMNVAGIFVWMFATTDNKEISSALDQSGMNHKVTYVFLSSLQMVQVLRRNSQIIMTAQRARGVETEGNLLVRARAFLPSLVPLILGSITGAEERVLTLESKGFDVEGKKTRLFKVEHCGWEKPAAVLSVLITLAIVAWRVLLWLL